MVQSEGLLVIPQFVLRISPSSETWWVLVLQLFEQAPSIPMSCSFVLHVPGEWPNVLYLKEMWLSDRAAKACGTQSTTNPRCTELSFLPFGNSLLGKSRTYEVTFIHPLFIPVLSKESEWVSMAKISTKSLKQLLSQRPPENQKMHRKESGWRVMEGSLMS